MVLATGCHDTTIRLWDARTGACLAYFCGHTNQILSLAFSPDGRHLYSSSEDETLKVWEVETATCTNTTTLDRPYEGTDITGVTGLTPYQVQGIVALGATIGTQPSNVEYLTQPPPKMVWIHPTLG